MAKEQCCAARTAANRLVPISWRPCGIHERAATDASKGDAERGLGTRRARAARNTRGRLREELLSGETTTGDYDAEDFHNDDDGNEQEDKEFLNASVRLNPRHALAAIAWLLKVCVIAT